MGIDKQQLLNRAAEIRNAREEGENTPERVGSLLTDMVSYSEEVSFPPTIDFGQLDAMGMESVAELWGALLANEVKHMRYTVMGSVGHPVGVLEMFRSWDMCILTQVLTTNYELDLMTGKFEGHVMRRAKRYVRMLNIAAGGKPDMPVASGNWTAWRKDDGTWSKDALDHMLSYDDSTGQARYCAVVWPSDENGVDADDPADFPGCEVYGDAIDLRFLVRSAGGGGRRRVRIPEAQVPQSVGNSDAKAGDVLAGLFGLATYNSVVNRSSFEAFVVLWDMACGSYGRYNRATGLFELNGLTDITYEQARRIFRCMQVPPGPRRIDDAGLRTNLWVGNTLSEYDMRPDMSRLFRCATLEKVRVSVESYDYGCLPTSIERLFVTNMPYLTEVLGIIDCRYITASVIAPAYDTLLFPKCHTLKLKRITKDVQVCGFPALSPQSLQYWIEHAANTGVITITVHEDVYAKLHGTYEWGSGVNQSPLWRSLLDLAAEKRITFAVKS